MPRSIRSAFELPNGYCETKYSSKWFFFFSFITEQEAFFRSSVLKKPKLGIKILNPIGLRGFFYHYFLQKQLIEILDFFSHRYSHQKYYKSKISTFSWAWGVLSTFTQIFQNFPEMFWNDRRSKVRLNIV